MTRPPDAASLRADALPDRPRLCRDIGWRRLEVRGADAQSFLQGQLTVDLTRLPTGQHWLAAWCTARGRVWSLARLWAAGDGYDLLVPASLAEAWAQRLRLYVLRAAVTITPDSAPVGGEIGPADAFGPAGTLEPLATGTALNLESGQRIVLGPESPAAETEAEEQWLALRLLAGEAQIGPETQDRFLPQSLGLSEGHGLNFNKGCYIGQEIVARVHYRGRAPQRLALKIDPPPAELEKSTVLARARTAGHELVQIVEAA